MYDIGATEINDYQMEKWFDDVNYTRAMEPDCYSCNYRNQCDAIGEVKRCSAYYKL